MNCRQLKINLPAFTFTKNNLDRRFIEPQFLSEGVDQISVIGEMDCLGVVCDNG